MTSVNANSTQKRSQGVLAAESNCEELSQDSASSPYLGPRPFAASDRARFFGRDREIEDIASLVAAHQTVLLIGGSGVGKTSLINAGLLPALNKKGLDVRCFAADSEGQPDGHNDGYSRTARVGISIPDAFTASQVQKISNIYVFCSLVSLAGKDADLQRLAGSEMDLTRYLMEELDVERTDPAKPLVLVFDQFEELFTYPPPRPNEQREFFKQVAKALTMEKVPLRVVFAMREEYLSRLETHAWLLPDELRTRYRLTGLRASSALRAVKSPVEANDRANFEPGAAEELVRRLRTFRTHSLLGETQDVEGDFVEPMHLQLVCRKLWRRCQQQWHSQRDEARTITKAAVEEHAIVETALEDFYDETVREAVSGSDVPEWRLREWCENLITLEGTRGAIVRDIDTTGGIPNEVVRQLDERHLIRGEERSGGLWYELTHDRFIDAIKDSNAKRGIHDRRDKLRAASISVVVLALSDLRLTDSRGDWSPDDVKPDSTTHKPPERTAIDAVATLKNPEVEFFFWQVFGSSLPNDEKYKRLVWLFELQESLNQRLLEAEGPDEDTREGMQKLVATVAQREGIWKPAELIGRTEQSIRDAVAFLQRSRRNDRGWGYPDKDSQVWATGHALMALCEASLCLNLDNDDRQIISEGLNWMLEHSWEWHVERIPPPDERSMYGVGIGLISMARAQCDANPEFHESATPLIEQTIRCVCQAQNDDGGWDAGIWREGHPFPTGVYSEAGATSFAVQSLVAWHDLPVPEIEPVIHRAMEWLRATQNEDGSWNGGSCQPGHGPQISGDPSVTKTCDDVRGLRAGIDFKRTGNAAEAQDEKRIRRALEWVRQQERRVRTETGACAIGWSEDYVTHKPPDSVITCMTLETLVQLDDVPLPLFTANAQWLMDSQNQEPDSPAHGSWLHGDSFRSTLCLIEYYKRIRTSPFFVVVREDPQSAPDPG